MCTIKTLTCIESLVEELCARNSIYSSIIIYGYKNIGEMVLEFLMHNYYQIRTSQYSGRIRCFATSYDNYESREGQKEIKGLPIYHIEQLVAYKETDYVIVAARESSQPEMVNNLLQLGFKRILCISKELYTKLQICNRKVVGEKKLEVMEYNLNHQAKVEGLRQKVKAGEKLKVLFMAHNTAVFGSKSLYQAMMNSDLFEPYILVFSKRDKIDEDYMKQVELDCSVWEERGYRVLSAHDRNNYLVDLGEYNPDIVFIDYPNAYDSASVTHTRGDLLNWKYLTCYIPYGCLMANSFYYHFETMNTRCVWKFFLDTKYSYKRSISEADFNAGNTVLSGYPKFDDYFEQKDNLNIPMKINNGKKIIIYAPHWSINISNRYSTFHLYYKYFLQLVKDNPNINFVFKPHPQLGYRIKDMERLQIPDMITYEEYLKYVKEWEELPNGFYMYEGDYIDLFRASAGMITDCGSFIGEYALSDNPCLYLLNPQKENPLDGYTDVAKSILDSYYLCSNLDEVKMIVQNVFVEDKDIKQKERERIIRSEFYNIGNAGKYICDYLEKQFI